MPNDNENGGLDASFMQHPYIWTCDMLTFIRQNSQPQDNRAIREEEEEQEEQEEEEEEEGSPE
ncbi:hypothetical protein EYF80_042036 [Liparis tanakae]|uniref:Uncharacterized protein n=1 Tax=Liparis tanakae TaxID=230148 RepID=A0A4Z2G4G4_9TELE|nr:hypothetical protein EYF80_042036 [Liparis tanakae]